MIAKTVNLTLYKRKANAEKARNFALSRFFSKIV